MTTRTAVYSDRLKLYRATMKHTNGADGSTRVWAYTDREAAERAAHYMGEGWRTSSVKVVTDDEQVAK